MKILLILAFLLLAPLINGQKLFMNKFQSRIADSASALYYEILVPADSSGLFRKTVYHITGEKESECLIKSVDGKTVQAGKKVTWYKNGRIKSEIDSTHVITYWPNGAIKRQDYFTKAMFQKGTCFDSLGNEIPYFPYLKKAYYPGGDKNILTDIARKTVYPLKSKNLGIQGRVEVRFVVDENGNVAEAYIHEGVNQELNDAAIRVVKKLKKFIPASCDGEPSEFWFMIPITFHLRQ